MRSGRRRGELGQPLGPGDVERQRLLADDVLAGGQRRLGERQVKMVRRAHVHDIHVGRFDERLARVECPVGAEPPGRHLRVLERRIGHADEPPPASRAARACTVPMKPAPAIPTRSSPSSAFIADSSSVPRRSSSISGVATRRAAQGSATLVSASGERHECEQTLTVVGEPDCQGSLTNGWACAAPSLWSRRGNSEEGNMSEQHLPVSGHGEWFS